MLYKNYINGAWTEASGGQVFKSINPANGEILGEFSKSSAKEVALAVEAAATAFQKWRLYPAPRRGEILYKAAQIMQERKEELSRLMTSEMGKVINEARGDFQEGIDMTFFMAGEGRRMYGHTTPSEMPNKFQMTLRDPLGVVSAITPWNFPFAIPTWKIMPALVTGNTVVFKPSSDTPLLAVKLVEIMEEAGLPRGVLNLVIGGGNEVGEAILKHPQIAAVSFTGSTITGGNVAVESVRLGKHVSLEMGGKNAIMVMEDADLDLAVEGIIWSAYGTTGQRCTACSRVIVHRDVEKSLTAKLLSRIEKLRLGDGLASTTDVGPVINQKQLASIHKYTAVAREDGAQILCGGEIATDGVLAKGSFYKPTLFGGVTRNMRVAQEEIFGPSLSIIAVDSLEEAIEVNNDTKFGLSSSIYTQNINRAFLAIRDITTGIVYINAGTIGAETHLPFGGRRGTGNGHREAAWTALDFFSEWKTVYIDYSGKLQKAQIDEVDLNMA